MGELIRRLDYERRASHLFRKDAKTRFLTKEFSQPVKSANALVQKAKVRKLTNLSEEMKCFGIKHDLEKEGLETFRKGLGLKSANFDEYRFQQTRSKSPLLVRNTTVLSVEKLVRTVPSNYVLEFGPGNKPIYTTNDKRGFRKIVSASDSPIFMSRRRSSAQTSNRSRSACRPQSQIGLSISRSASVGMEQRAVPKPRGQSYLFAKRSPPSTFEHTDSRHQITSRQQRRYSSLSDSDNENDNDVFDEEYPDEIDEKEQMSSSQKSYRHLREEYSIKSKVLPDYHKESLKRLKNMEMSHLQALGERIQKFTAGIQPTRGKQKDILTITSSFRH